MNQNGCGRKARAHMKHGFFSNARSATPATQKTKVMGCPQVHACHAKLKVIRCPQAPRLPRELMVDVAKCHACHAKPTCLPACLPTYLYYLLIIKFISFEGCFTYQILWNPNGIWWVSWGFNCEPKRLRTNMTSDRFQIKILIKNSNLDSSQR